MNKDQLLRMSANGALTTSITHHRARVNWPMVAVGLLIVVAAIVVMWPEK